MKKNIYLMLTLNVFIFFNLSSAQYFKQPESVFYDDLNDRYLISNSGSGKIVQLTSTDTSFTDFEGTRGMIIVDSTLFAVKDVSMVRGYDLSSNETILDLEISEAVLLNDITVDSSGFLYVTDFNGSKIYKVNRNTQDYSIFVSQDLESPNGIFYDAENNRLLFCESYNRKIKAVNLADSTVKTIISNGYLYMDGITRDSRGNIYVSNWQKNAVYRYDPSFANPPTLVSSGHKGPADIFINQKTNILVVPNYDGNSIRFIQLDTSSVDNRGYPLPAEFNLRQNYPNPFNPSTTISYSISKSGFVILKVYNLLGREIQTLVQEFQTADTYTVTFEAANMPGGIYFYRLQTGNHMVETRKMLLLK